MLADRSHPAAEIVLGPFEVVAEPARIADFAAATGRSSDAIPATFPIVWLSDPQIKHALRAALGPDHLPVHEQQAFDYSGPLAPGGRYRLSAVARRESGPDRLIVEARVAETGGAPTLSMRAILRVVPLTGSTP